MLESGVLIHLVFFLRENYKLYYEETELAQVVERRSFLTVGYGFESHALSFFVFHKKNKFERRKRKWKTSKY